MKTISTGNVLGQMIIRACGIPCHENGGDIRRIEVICEAGEVATVNVHYVAEISAASGIVEAIKQFRLEAV